ncbi:hypothetical protein Javan90_0031 [Streptococcus phage Javan90]|nr:hypothetical protein Javan87_0032 [Streptococcus phage Javan87]QBX32025.1 hypothetical protein Javan90_0031 [Streptococcus phage Javan90]
MDVFLFVEKSPLFPFLFGPGTRDRLLHKIFKCLAESQLSRFRFMDNIIF